MAILAPHRREGSLLDRYRAAGIEGKRNAQRTRAAKKAATVPAVQEKFGLPVGAKLRDKLDAIGRRVRG